MAKVAIVTDSTADLARELQQALGLQVVPLNVHFGETVYQDGIDITPQQFYAKVPASAHHPSTSAPAPGQFLEVYRRLHAEGKRIVSVHISSKLSATVQSAVMAKEMLPEAEVEVVDSQSVSLGLGLVVMAAARKAVAGAALSEVAAEARAVAERMQVLCAVDTLDYLARNGRIGKAQAFVGSLLHFKPLIAVTDGQVVPADRVRGKGKVLPRVLELLAEQVPEGSSVRAAVLHAGAEAEAERWAAALRERYRVQELTVGWIGPVVGAHAGPGAVGAVVYQAS